MVMQPGKIVFDQNKSIGKGEHIFHPIRHRPATILLKKGRKEI